MNDFLTAVAAVLECGEVTLDTRFRETPEWSSLKAFGLLVMMENDWGSPLDINEFSKFETVRDLYREAFLNFAAGLFKVKREILSGNTKYESIPEWDSVNHLRLVMEAEKHFGSHYQLERIPFLLTLDEFLV